MPGAAQRLAHYWIVQPFLFALDCCRFADQPDVSVVSSRREEQNTSNVPIGGIS
jgi:hypothetical protein